MSLEAAVRSEAAADKADALEAAAEHEAATLAEASQARVAALQAGMSTAADSPTVISRRRRRVNSSSVSNAPLTTNV